MTKPKDPQELVDQIKSAHSPPPPDAPTNGEPMGQPQHWLGELGQAIRAEDEAAIDGIKHRQELLREQVEVLIFCVEDYDSAALEMAKCEGAAADAERIAEELRYSRGIRLDNVSDAKKMARDVAQLESELRDAQSRVGRYGRAENDAAGTRCYCPELFGDPASQRSEEQLRQWRKRHPQATGEDAYRAYCVPAPRVCEKLVQMGLSDPEQNSWRDFRRPEPIQPRKRYRLVPGGTVK